MALSTLAGRLIVEHHEPLDASLEPALWSRSGFEPFSTWALEQHQKDRDIWGIGLALPGPVEASAEQPFASPAPPFLPALGKFVPFVEELVATFGAPCWVRSTIEMMTAGELLTGTAQDVNDMLFVDLSREFNAGLVFGRRALSQRPRKSRVSLVILL